MQCSRFFLFLFLILVFIFPWKLARGQRFVGGLKGGLVASEVSGDNLSGPNKLGWFGAIFTNTQTGDFSRLQLELLYSQKGSRSVPSEKNNFYDYRFSLKYAEVPILLILDFPWSKKGSIAEKLSIETGLSAAFLVGSNEVEDDRKLDLSEEKPFFGKELNFLLGLYYPITSQFLFHLRFSQGITPLRPHESSASIWYNRGQYNTAWIFGLVWLLL